MTDRTPLDTPPIERANSFIGGAFRNRRYTRLSSSIVLSMLFLAVFVTPAVMAASTTKNGGTTATAGVVMLAVIGGLNAFFYPLVREVYFRMTQPMREGVGLLFLGGVLILILWGVKIFVALLLWTFAFLLGIPAFLYLAVTEANGRGWRLVG